MDSLPEPSETVEDEWASMKIRFRKEGLDWSKLSDQDRILQVTSDQNQTLYSITDQSTASNPDIEISLNQTIIRALLTFICLNIIICWPL